MKISELVAELVKLQVQHGDLEVTAVSEHSEAQKTRGAQVMYVEDITQHYLEEVDPDDVEDQHTQVVVVYT